MAKESTAVALIDSKSMLPVINSMKTTLERYQEAHDGDLPTIFDQPRARVPAGGGKRWSIVLGGEIVEEAESLEGFVIFARTNRSFWRGSIEEGGNLPPDCSSIDGKTGIGDPGGSCKTCQYNQFVKNDAGKSGKQCKEFKVLLVLNEKKNWPIPIILPTMSIKPFNNWVDGMIFGNGTGSQSPFYAIKARITLIQDKNQSGITYSKAKFESLGEADDALTAELTRIYLEFKGSSDTITINSDDVLPF